VRPDLHDSLFDSWMLSNFPGRMLEELDGMDILRYLRAMDARAIETTERVNGEIGTGKMAAVDVPADRYKKILEHNEMFEEYKNSKRGKKNG
jgi:hypothetical protein